MVYLADFGISRNYTDLADMETDGTIPFARRYCAPEVALGRCSRTKADVFFLGCVFAEIFTIIAGKTTEEFLDARNQNSDATYHNNMDKSLEWIGSLEWQDFDQTKRQSYQRIVPELIKEMLGESPQIRLAPRGLTRHICSCCLKEPEQYRAAQ